MEVVNNIGLQGTVINWGACPRASSVNMEHTRCVSIAPQKMDIVRHKHICKGAGALKPAWLQRTCKG